ncbi:MAG: DUF885 family protein [Acidimicrobiales bacterium]
MVHPRVKAAWDCSIAETREYAGVHDYDGVVQDLSPDGVRTALDALGDAGTSPIADRHDRAHLEAYEAGLRAQFAVAEMHRWNPLYALSNLDLACYDREYAPAADRQSARAAHLAQWPEAIEASLQSLDRIPQPVAAALERGVAGLAAGVEDEAALAAHSRLLEVVHRAAGEGTPDARLGAAVLTRLLGDPEGMTIDLGKLEEAADRERGRLKERLVEACQRVSAGKQPADVVRELLADHPTQDELIYGQARDLIAEATAFTYERDLLPPLGGACLVGPAPASRSFVVAMMSWTGPYEADAPAWYYVNPPDPSWGDEAKAEWRSMFSATTLPSITVHEVTPGHFAHGRMLQLFAKGDIRRSLYSSPFVEGWAHYAEELFVEEGFRQDDPRFAVGVWIEALLRVTRFAAALGVHGGSMTVEEATRRFEEDAFLLGPAARSEATRATFDPTYGRYTWGKLEIMALRDEAIAAWGSKFSLRRFHEALLSLGGPPLGTMGDAIEP